jgi:hypothetical protein
MLEKIAVFQETLMETHKTHNPMTQQVPQNKNKLKLKEPL